MLYALECTQRAAAAAAAARCRQFVALRRRRRLAASRIVQLVNAATPPSSREVTATTPPFLSGETSWQFAEIRTRMTSDAVAIRCYRGLCGESYDILCVSFSPLARRVLLYSPFIFLQSSWGMTNGPTFCEFKF